MNSQQAEAITSMLKQTLNPQKSHITTPQILQARTNEGFITQLLIIGVDQTQDMNVRQSALIHIKNALIDKYSKQIQIPNNDFQTVKSSILQSLIRNCTSKALSPTLREIIYILAQVEFPANWPDIIQEIVGYMQKSVDFDQLLGSVDALKAIVSALGSDYDKKVVIQNLCSKIVMPLLNLASKLFQNYNQSTSVILCAIFKIISTVTYFHLPEVIAANIHSLMIFIKKLLDISLQGQIDPVMFKLKKICLRILYRIYQRHLNKYTSKCPPSFIQEFHSKFTRGFIETLVLQIINEQQLQKQCKLIKGLQLSKFALSCLGCIFGQDRASAEIISKYSEKILQICLQKYKLNLNKTYPSFEDFRQEIESQRYNLSQFLKALLHDPTWQEQCFLQGQSPTPGSSVGIILGCLFELVQKGDNALKEVCLYFFAQLSTTLPEVDPAGHQHKLQTFLLNAIVPLLFSQDSPDLVKLRCCQFLSRYSYIQIPQSQVKQIGQGVYGCLLAQSTPNCKLLQAYSVPAFNSILRYESIVEFSSAFLKDLLQAYTSLLDVDINLIKCLQDMLQKFQPFLHPFSENLIELLMYKFSNYNTLMRTVKENGPTTKGSGFSKNGQNQQYEDQDDDDDVGYNDDDQDGSVCDNNYLLASRACLGAIRQVLQSPKVPSIPLDTLLVAAFSDPDGFYLEQALNLLNLSLFKHPRNDPALNAYFTLLVYAVLPVPSQLVESLQNAGNPQTQALLSMMKAVCSQPDSGFVQSSIGCFRNYIAKFGSGLVKQEDALGSNFLSLIIEVVKYVHENQSSKFTQSDRSIILTLYMSLIEYQAVDQTQTVHMLEQINGWIAMQKQLLEQNQQKNQRLVYCPIYLQIVSLSVHFYPKSFLQVFSGDWTLVEVLFNWERFTCASQLSRIIIGLADMISYEAIKDQSACTEMLNRLPDTISYICRIRTGQEKDQINSIEDEAEQEDLQFGDDQNTHIFGKKTPLVNVENGRQKNSGNQPKQQDMQSESSQDSDTIEQDFNNYYVSPYDEIDEIEYLSQALKSESGSKYVGLMEQQKQQKLSYLITNAPAKTKQQVV